MTFPTERVMKVPQEKDRENVSNWWSLKDLRKCMDKREQQREWSRGKEEHWDGEKALQARGWEKFCKGKKDLMLIDGWMEEVP